MSIHYKKYENYDAYVNHQSANLKSRHKYFTKMFKARHKRIGTRIHNGLKPLSSIDGPVLCLGSRLGEEVKVFRDMNMEALGIDLFPGYNNPYVIQGDFHDIKFDNNTFGLVYTNSLDHALQLDKVAKECARVLKDDGILFLDVTTNKTHVGEKQLAKCAYESMVWDDIEDILLVFKNQNFVELHRSMECNDCDGQPFLGVILQLTNGDKNEID